jgi:c(7)-type cytochrome triheme protein
MHWINLIKTGFMLTVVMTLLLSIGLVEMCGADQERGLKDLILEGGASGEVPFPHHQHQDRLPDCQVCHQLFPQKKGAIQALISQGDIKKRTVMNTQCVDCHRKTRAFGTAGGPIGCKDCHRKK